MSAAPSSLPSARLRTAQGLITNRPSLLRKNVDQHPSKRPPRRMGPCAVRNGAPGRDHTYYRGGRCRLHQPAICLIRAISSSVALSTGTFSLTTRFIALAQTFSLLRIVNFQFLVKSNGVVPPVNWLYTALRCRSACHHGLCWLAVVTGNQRPSAPSM